MAYDTLLEETDLLLRIVISSVEGYEQFLRDHLSQPPVVNGTVPSIVLWAIRARRS